MKAETSKQIPQKLSARLKLVLELLTDYDWAFEVPA